MNTLKWKRVSPWKLVSECGRYSLSCCRGEPRHLRWIAYMQRSGPGLKHTVGITKGPNAGRIMSGTIEEGCQLCENDLLVSVQTNNPKL